LINTIWDIPLFFFAKSEEELGTLPSLPLEASGKVRVISSTPNWGSTEILNSFLLAFQSAHNTIYITQSYFIPNDRVRSALIDASHRGVDVKIILPQNPDVLLVKSATEMFYEELLEGGVRIFEWKGTMLHAKTIVIDGIHSTIASSNIDNRSFLLSYECNVIVYDEGFGDAMEKTFEEDLMNCEEITLENRGNRSWWEHLRNILLIPIISQL